MAINLQYKLRRIEEVRAAARKRSRERYRKARKGLRGPEYVARELGITVEAARQLMFDGEE